MVIINYPEPDFNIKKEGTAELIFDSFRKRWVTLTPEEWVRQNFLRYLLEVKNYPASMVAVEKEIKLGELKKRFDILVYNQQHQPWMMIECKAMGIEADEKVLAQILRYNMSIPVEYIIITNGKQTHGWQKLNNTIVPVEELPQWP
jgi:hypothetical protein